jgi:hypothetical protein
MSDDNMFEVSVTMAEFNTIMALFSREGACAHSEALTERGYMNIVVGISPDLTYRYPSLTLVVDDPAEYEPEAMSRASEKAKKRINIHGAIDSHFTGKLNKLVDEQPLHGYDVERMREARARDINQELNEEMPEKDGQPPIEWPVDDPHELPPDEWDGPDGWDEGRT